MDELVRAVAADGFIKIAAVKTTEMVERARLIHKCTPVISAALGRTMAATSMIGNMLKGDDESVTVRINGGGPCGSIVAVADSTGNVRAYAQNPYVNIPLKPNGKLDVGAAVGRDGTLTVIKDLGLKEPYSGQTNLITGEIAEDLTYYFAQSEQTPSSVGLGVLVDVDQTILASGGFLLQLMPNTDQKTIDQLEKNIKNFVGVTPYLSQGHSLEEMMDVLFEGFDHEVTDTMDVSWKCNCSFERGKEVLATLKREEIVNMIEEGKPVEVNCDFCQSHYRYDIEDLKEVLSHIDEQAK